MKITSPLRTLAWTLASFVILAAQQKNDWPWIRYVGIRGPIDFWDLNAVLKSSDCAKVVGWQIYNSDSLSGRCKYIYGSILIRIINILNIGESNTQTIGWIFIVSLSLLIGILFSLLKVSLLTSLVFLLIFLSPPNMLLIERGNLDNLILILLFLTAVTVSKGWLAVAHLLVMLVSLTKFYPVPLFIWLYFQSKRQALKALSIVFFIGSTILIAIDIVRIESFPRPIDIAFGNPIFGLYLNRLGLPINLRMQDLIGILMLTSTSFLLHLTIKRFRIILPEVSVLSKPRDCIDSLFIVFALVFLVCYLASTNYDYRLIYLMIPAVVYIMRTPGNGLVSHALTFLLFVASIFAVSVSNLQMIGDFATLVWVALLLRCLTKGTWREYREKYV